MRARALNRAQKQYRQGSSQENRHESIADGKFTPVRFKSAYTARYLHGLLQISQSPPVLSRAPNALKAWPIPPADTDLPLRTAIGTIRSSMAVSARTLLQEHCKQK